jgi:hypothetical protein
MSATPPPIHRVVTGHDDQGKAVVSLNGALPTVVELSALPGTVFHEVWSTQGAPCLVSNGADPTLGALMLPPPALGTWPAPPGTGMPGCDAGTSSWLIPPATAPATPPTGGLPPYCIGVPMLYCMAPPGPLIAAMRGPLLAGAMRGVRFGVPPDGPLS